jgi:hypothetical protein
MLGHAHTSPIVETGKPLSAHGSSSPEVMRPSLGIKSRANQLQYQSPQEMNPNSYSPLTNPSSGTYSGAGSSNGAEFTQSTGFKRSNSDSMNRGQDGGGIGTPASRPQRHTSFGMADSKPPDFSRPPLQTTVGPYGLLSSASNNSYHAGQSSPQQPYVSQQNFTPFTLPPPGFSTSVTAAASTREADPTFPTSMPTDYQSETSHHQQSGPDMMLLDQMTAPNTMPVFGGEGYSRSPFAIPEDFVAYLFSGQQVDHTSQVGPISQQGYAKSVSSPEPPPPPASFPSRLPTNSSYSYLDAQNQYYTPYFTNDVNLGGFFPPSHQQPHHPMAVTSLLDTSLPETVLSEEKSQAIVDLIKERFNETDHAPVARHKEALLDGDRSDDNHMLSRKMMQTYIGSYWYHFSEQVPICRSSH